MRVPQYLQALGLFTLSFIVVLLGTGCSADSGTPRKDTSADTESTDAIELFETTEDDTGSMPDDTETEPEDITETNTPDTTIDTPPEEILDIDFEGPILSVVVVGSLEDRSPDDGLSAQTPEPYFYWLEKLELMRSDNDPNPEVIFDYYPSYVKVNMHAPEGAEPIYVGPIDQLPYGYFTHFRITLTVMDCEVEATLHNVPVLGTLITPLQITYALSDVDNDELTMRQGDVMVSGNIYGRDVTIPSHWPMLYPEPSPDARAESVDGKTQVTFTLSDPIDVSPDADRDVTQGVRYYIYNSFRWEDEDEEGYFENAWDIDVVTLEFEPIRRFGANYFEPFRE